ncbi:ACT domain-containing protein [uncultured Fusobacterium sp.]|uniref:ACT domain-containing protein n=1 Tax=uncultured Fusobacterium sp. TaxID=159267 RepID=UPI0027DBD910|nr:ACT domain-containing protein [uncultured Fusobacterium sp.]
MNLKILPNNFSICKIKNLNDINYEDEFIFIGKTDEELSLVCSTKYVPQEYIECNNNWKGFRIEGVLDFSLIGILAKISSVLAENGISIFAVSTYNTDYILLKSDKFDKAIEILKNSNYIFK